MPRRKVTERYKLEKKNNRAEKLQQYRKLYRESRKEQYNEQQKLLMQRAAEKLRQQYKSNHEVIRKKILNKRNVQNFRNRHDKQQQNETRKSVKNRWSKCTEQFEQTIRQYHSHVCNCCGKMCRISQLKSTTKTALINANCSNELLEKVFWITKNEETKFCKTCMIYITKRQVPKLALCNGLDFPEVDSEIKALNRIEERLLAPRHVFQTLWTIQGPSGQLKTKGGIVNVPVEVDNSVSYLPRPINDSSMIHVRLARKLEYVKDYMTGVVRTKLLYNAAKKFVQKPLPVEENISLSMNWNMNNYNTETIDPEDDFFVQSAIYETLLINNEENVTFTGLHEQSLRIAPAEGFRPTSILFDNKCEFLAFPTIFGGYEMKPMYNNKEISYADYAKSVAMRYDRRVATRGDLLLFMAKKLEILKLNNNIGIILRKKSATREITASEMLSSSYVNNLIQHDEGYKCLKGVRNSPAHWQAEKTKLLAQIRQFGLPTLFLTLSAADLKWPELLVSLKKIIDNEDISEADATSLSFSERAKLIQKDPITCALHFDERFKALRKTWNSNEGPFGDYKIIHHYHRIEFQQRGSPHVHALLWLESAPQFVPEIETSGKTVCKFVDEIISCSSDQLTENLVKLQTHKHSHTCKKNKQGNEYCRFQIPYFPMKKTIILSQLKEDVTDEQRNCYRKIYKNIKEALNDNNTLSLTFDQFLKKLNITHENYQLAIRMSLQKPQIYLKRDPKDIFISPFSPKIIQLMRSNMNLQFVLDAFGAACYIIDYINKSDRGMSDIMRKVLQEIRNGNIALYTAILKMCTTYHNNSELSIQEACYNILQLHMSESSERCIFIQTFPPHERVRMVKSREDLENLNNDSTDIFQEGLLQHYSKRPVILDSLTLAEFASQYNFSKIYRNGGIKLQDNSGFIYRKTKPLIIRYRNYHYETDPDEYLREHLMLYHPWRNEENDITNQNWEAKFSLHQETIKCIKQKFCAFDDLAIDQAINEAKNRIDSDEDSDSENFEGEQTSETVFTPNKFDFFNYKLNYPSTNNIEQVTTAEKRREVYFTLPSKLPEENFQQLFEKLNQDQRDYIMTVCHHFETKNDQIFHFLTGGAGVGKSLVINTLYQTLFRIFNSDSQCNPDEPKILLCAPTGMAAFNIGGQTLHSAFKIRPNTNSLEELSPSVSNTLACCLHKLKVLIIDEISMVSQHIFEMVSKRLQHLKGNNLPFGGISVIVVGDFAQLIPVFGRSLISPFSSNPYAEIFGKNLWTNFKVFQLTKIMRQNEIQFQTALINTAKGALTDSDKHLLNTRVFNEVPSSKKLKNATHLFATNADVDKFNESALNSIPGPHYISKASDILEGSGSALAKRQILFSASNSRIQDTMGIPNEVKLKIGAKYMITYNIDTNDGLCNGATGILKQIDFGINENKDKKALRLWIKFSEQRIGIRQRQRHYQIMKTLNISQSWTPLDPSIVTIKTRKNCSLQVNRMQFAITPAHALTIHKSQGQSLKKVVVHMSPRMSRQLIYVAYSRATSLKGLYIIGKLKPLKKLTKTDHLYQEKKRWKHNKINLPFNAIRDHSGFQIMYHNVQSLPKHANLVINDLNFMTNDILLFGELWMSRNERIEIPSFTLVEHLHSNTHKKPNGVCAYIKTTLRSNVIDHGSFTIASSPNKIETVWLKLRLITVVGLYAKPNTPMSLWKTWFKTMDSLNYKDLLIMGDFNINFLNVCPSMTKLLKQYKLKLINKTVPTTHHGTGLDWILTNTKVEHGSYSSYFSYHFPIWARLASFTNKFHHSILK